MDELSYVYGIAAVIALYFLAHVISRKFDPFAPVWLFLFGYSQIYVAQAISFYDYAIRARGPEVTAAANFRALWALCWFLVVYQFGPGRLIGRKLLPKPPEAWSHRFATLTTPFLAAWGAVCGIWTLRLMVGEHIENSAEEVLFFQFPILLMASGVLLIVTGRDRARPQPSLTAIGFALCITYICLWVFNTKRSHSLVGILGTVCAHYVSRGKRPSFVGIASTALAGVLAVSLAIGWRFARENERSLDGFVEFLAQFNTKSITSSFNLDLGDAETLVETNVSRETEEYGGYLLMMDTVPAKSAHDYGASYIRMVSTFIPRIVWADKPIYGREEWISAWIAGSEYPRDSEFTGPAIGILGATQLNGGAVGTIIVLGIVAVLLRAGYEYFRANQHTPWAQAWWAMTYYNAWFMTVNDDPFVWFYYVYGHGLFPLFVGYWVVNRLNGGTRTRAGRIPAYATS